MEKCKTTKEWFIEQAKIVHGDKFDYSKVDYKGITKPVTIICREHGEFSQTPKVHLKGHGCKICYGHYKLSNEEFIEKAKVLHPEYDYSKAEYDGSVTKVKLICPEHGEFLITPSSLLRGRGCKKCGSKRAQEKNRMTKNEFLLKAREIHGWKYDYSKVDYINTETKVCIICPEHGEFWQSPHHHLNGNGCPECGKNDITENKLYEEIKSRFPDAIHTYKPEFLRGALGKPQSIDIYIPSLKTGIEYQGRQHFVPVSRYGGEKELILTKERDKRKFALCVEHGVELLYVSFEKEAPDTYLSTIYRNTDKLFEKIGTLSGRF